MSNNINPATLFADAFISDLNAVHSLAVVLSDTTLSSALSALISDVRKFQEDAAKKLTGTAAALAVPDSGVSTGNPFTILLLKQECSVIAANAKLLADQLRAKAAPAAKGTTRATVPGWIVIAEALFDVVVPFLKSGEGVGLKSLLGLGSNPAVQKLFARLPAETRAVVKNAAFAVITKVAKGEAKPFDAIAQALSELLVDSTVSVAVSGATSFMTGSMLKSETKVLTELADGIDQSAREFNTFFSIAINEAFINALISYIGTKSADALQDKGKDGPKAIVADLIKRALATTGAEPLVDGLVGQLLGGGAAGGEKSNGSEPTEAEAPAADATGLVDGKNAQSDAPATGSA